jgi:hypothetical protein
MQSLDFIMFTGARFPDYCNGTSNPVQQLTINVLVDLGSHQQPKIATSGYITWETGPWQQEQQHQMSQVSDEYRQTVRNCLRETVRLPRAALHMLTQKGHVWSTATIRSLNSIIGHLDFNMIMFSYLNHANVWENSYLEKKMLDVAGKAYGNK